MFELISGICQMRIRPKIYRIRNPAMQIHLPIESTYATYRTVPVLHLQYRRYHT